MGQGRRIEQWQQLGPPFSFPPQGKGAGSGGRRAVARRFIGESRNKVDSKGRVSIPALFRRVLEAGDPDWKEGLRPQFVIVYGDHRKKFLECFTAEAHSKVAAKIEEKPRASLERRMLERLFHGQSFPTEVDNDGRIVLPQKLREKIDLGEEAFFIASGDTFQIWKPETYETEELARTEAWLDQFPEDFDPLSLLDAPSAAAAPASAG
jgi:MraZ protein